VSFRVSSSNFHHQHCLQEHRDVYEAIRKRDPDAARKAVEVLLYRADEDVRSVMTK
jgi:DNA-binding FadR family transcriptional regulator